MTEREALTPVQGAPEREQKPWPLAGYAPGDYMCVCVRCEKQFMGDKRAIICLECAAIAVKNRAAEARLAPEGVAVAYAPKGHLKRYLKGKNTACWVYGSPTGTDDDALYASPPPVSDTVLREALIAVVEAVRAYLPPDGIGRDECISRVIAATDNPNINPVIASWEGRDGRS